MLIPHHWHGALHTTGWSARKPLPATETRGSERQNLARLELGRYILAALEVLIVADVIRTALTMQLQGLIFLGGLVIIRSAISWFLDREIEALEKDRKHDAPQMKV